MVKINNVVGIKYNNMFIIYYEVVKHYYCILYSFNSYNVYNNIFFPVSENYNSIYNLRIYVSFFFLENVYIMYLSVYEMIIYRIEYFYKTAVHLLVTVSYVCSPRSAKTLLVYKITIRGIRTF